MNSSFLCLLSPSYCGIEIKKWDVESQLVRITSYQNKRESNCIQSRKSLFECRQTLFVRSVWDISRRFDWSSLLWPDCHGDNLQPEYWASNGECSPLLLSVDQTKQELQEKHQGRTIILGFDIGQQLQGVPLKFLAFERLLQDAMFVASWESQGKWKSNCFRAALSDQKYKKNFWWGCHGLLRISE